jgi:hypothetical protein
MGAANVQQWISSAELRQRAFTWPIYIAHKQQQCHHLESRTQRTTEAQCKAIPQHQKQQMDRSANDCALPSSRNKSSGQVVDVSAGKGICQNDGRRQNEHRRHRSKEGAIIALAFLQEMKNMNSG